ncbi:hypothetical protein VZT92_002317 [Zoarces viviparus]|uniref:Immunoglobulin domain-containing protein n=1 Tax=Zoarces viviparus TaxID=48416 RepID=A0AAW1G0B7_ZOAVI
MRMWSLEQLLFSVCIALICVSSAAGSVHVSGYEGGHVNVSCPYSEEPNKSKYSIHDEKRVFTATISDLSRTDAGKYWCGVTRTGKDIYTEVDLEVGQDSCCERSTKFRSDEESSVSISCPYESQHQNNLKYICRGNQPSTCLEKAIITSDNHQTEQFRLTDDKVSRKFTVTITGLTQNNIGSYLCGVHGSTGLDVFSAFELEVKEWCCVRSNKLSGIVGRPVTVQCPYPPQHSDNRKFLCKGDHRNNCTEMVRSRSRFTLQDDASSSSFWVIITELKAEDAGTYWCGSDSQWSVGNYTKIQLSAVLPQQSSPEISPITVVEDVGSQSTLIPGERIKASSHFVVFIVPAVLLTLTFGLVIVYKYKCNKVQGAGANVNRGNAAETQEGIAVSDIYENQDVARSKQGYSKPKSAGQHSDDEASEASETQQESVYQNYTSTEDIYTNQIQIEASRR